MKPPVVSLEKILALAPACLSMEIPTDYVDSNGHMNMRWYSAIFDEAGDTLHERVGLTPEYHRLHRTGTFDLEHHLHFLSEVNPGERVAVYMRFVERSAKRLHYMMFLVNETRSGLAAGSPANSGSLGCSAIFECMNCFADLNTRKTAPWPQEIASRIDEILAEHRKLDWPPPVCGAMQA